MKIVTLNPLGAKSWFLFDTMEETFSKHGHSFTDNADEADVAFFDLGTGHAVYDDRLMQRVFDLGLRVVAWDQFEYTNPPPESSEWLGEGTKFDIVRLGCEGRQWAQWLWKFMGHGRVSLHFIRRMPRRWIEFSAYCRPLDLVMYPDCDFPPATKEEFNSRPFDVGFVGSTSPWRENAVRDLRNSPLKVDLEFLKENGRLERDVWLNRQRQCKLFLSGDGPGDCSDRPYQLFAVSPMLKFRNFHRLPAPWTHGVDCIEAADEFGNMQPGDDETILEILNDPERLYSIYIKGIEHIKTHNTFEARSEYVLRAMKSVGLK